MNTIGRMRFGVTLLLTVTVTAACGDRITDFGFDGKLSGTVTDPSGNIISGDVATRNVIVFAHGERDDVPMEIRVKGDGTYANDHLYPQRYRVWVEGPVVSSATADNPVSVDLTGAPVKEDFTVTPFLSVATPQVAATAPTAISVSYQIQENEGKVAEERRVYVSTVSWPGSATGSGVSWKTVTRSLESNAGSVTVDGLTAGKKYYVRTAARAAGAGQWNISDQVIVNTQ